MKKQLVLSLALLCPALSWGMKEAATDAVDTAKVTFAVSSSQNNLTVYVPLKSMHASDALEPSADPSTFDGKLAASLITLKQLQELRTISKKETGLSPAFVEKITRFKSHLEAGTPNLLPPFAREELKIILLGVQKTLDDQTKLLTAMTDSL